MIKLTARCSVVLLLALFLSACATNDADNAGGPKVIRRLPTDAEVAQHNALVDPANRIMCRMETEVGSNIPKRNCRVERDLHELGIFHRDQLRNVLR